MKRTASSIVALCLAIALAGCNQQHASTPDATSTPDVTATSDVTSTSDRASAPDNATTEDSAFDPYATENRYDVPDSMFERRSDVDYGTLDKDVTYYSTVAEDDKQVNVLLPAGYDKSQTYPVLYVVHGFDASHNSHVNEDSYLTLLYGNMLHDGLTVPMVIVGVDMYTDKVIDEIHADLMPFIEQHYSVSAERKDTAVAGVSEGGAKSLCIGFTWLDEFGWIGSFAPDSNVIPTSEVVTSFWNDPYMEAFPMPDEDNTPYYLYLAVGGDDPWNIDCTLLYRDTLDNMGIRNQTDYAEGYGHNSKFWGQCFYNFLSKAFQ